VRLASRDSTRADGLPAQRHHPVVLDGATTVHSMQKVRVAAQQGTPMPEGIITDHDGRPTTDPKALLVGGLLAPLGAPHAPHKASAWRCSSTR
jgi:delta1-piperideine-2-carboxylate reductase